MARRTADTLFTEAGGQNREFDSNTRKTQTGRHLKWHLAMERYFRLSSAP